MLSANQFSLLRAQEIVPKLRAARLLDPDYVPSVEPGPLTVQLASAGYDRGMLTSMFAERLRALVQSIRDGHLDRLDDAVTARDERAAMQLLTGIKGIGPVVARTAWTLLVATTSEV
jgi:hypothetical protein